MVIVARAIYVSILVCEVSEAYSGVWSGEWEAIWV